jgi:hypothetical protein
MDVEKFKETQSMKIEDLNKSQLILLTIMVSFVVSIATGVLTVSMLNRAPVNVTQTVNKIVDHTIETIKTPIQISPSKPTPNTPSTEQLLTSAITLDVERMVRIYKDATTTSVLSYGTYLSKSHTIVTAFDINLPREVIISFSDGSILPASLSHTNSSVSLYGFADGAKFPAISSTALIPVSSLKQGQTVIAITKDISAVTGIVSKIDEDGIHTTLSGIPPGMAVVDLSGSLVGISSGISGLSFPTSKITSLLSSTTSISK